MAWSAKLTGGTVADFADDTRADMAASVQAAIVAATAGLKNDIKAQIIGADLGQGLSQAVGSRVYPASGASLAAAGIVFPRGREAEAIFDAFDTGAIIHANGTPYLALPTKDARLGRTRITPAQFQARTGIKLGAVRSKDGFVLVGAPRTGVRGHRGTKQAKPIVYFILVPIVHEKKKLDLESAAQTWASRIPDLIG